MSFMRIIKRNQVLGFIFAILLNLNSIAIASIATAPIQKPITMQENTEKSMFNIASSVLFSIIHGSSNSEWIQDALKEVSVVDEENDKLLELNLFAIGKNQIISQEGIEVAKEAKNFFDSQKQEKEQNSAISLPLTKYAQLRANSIARNFDKTSYSKEKSTGNTEEALKLIEQEYEIDEFQEYILSSCNPSNTNRDIVFDFIWQMLTSDGDQDRRIRDNIFKYAELIGVGISALQNQITQQSEKQCPIGSTIAVIHVAKNIKCLDSKDCDPIIPVPAKAFSTLQSKSLEEENQDWTLKWNKLNQNYNFNEVPFSSISAHWTRDNKFLRFYSDFEGPIYSPIINQMGGKIVWLYQNWVSDSPSQGSKWFEELWSKTAKNSDGFVIESKLLKDMKSLQIDIQFISSRNKFTISSNHGFLDLSLNHPVSPGFIDCNKITCNVHNLTKKEDSISRCLDSASSGCNHLIEESKDTLTSFEVLTTYSLINSLIQQPKAFAQLFDLEFEENVVKISIGPKVVKFKTKKGKDHFDSKMEEISNRKEVSNKLQLSYALSVSAQLRANELSTDDDKNVFRPSFDKILEYLIMKDSQEFKYIELVIKTCNKRFLVNAIQSLYLLFSEENSNYQFLEKLQSHEFTHIGIGFAMGEKNEDEECYPSNLVIHLSQTGECLYESCSIQIPSPLGSDHSVYYQQMYQNIISQKNKKDFGFMSLHDEISFVPWNDQILKTLKIKSIFVKNPGSSFNSSEGKFNWTISSVVAKHFEIPDMKFYHDVFEKQLKHHGEIQETDTLEIKLNGLDQVVSFDVFCTWSNHDESIQVSAIKPIRIQLYTYQDKGTFPPLVVRLSSEIAPLYKPLILRAISGYENQIIMWKSKQVIKGQVSYGDYLKVETDLFSIDYRTTIFVGTTNKSKGIIGKSIQYGSFPKDNAFELDQRNYMIKWKNFFSMETFDQETFIEIESEYFQNTMFIGWYSDITSKDGEFELKVPYLDAPVNVIAQISFSKYPEFKRKIVVKLKPKDKHKTKSIPIIAESTSSINELAFSLSSLINYVYHVKQTNNPVSKQSVYRFTINPRYCKHGQSPSVNSNTLQRDIEMSVCQCKENWKGTYCDIDEKTYKQFNVQLENFFSAIQNLQIKDDTQKVQILRLLDNIAKYTTQQGSMNENNYNIFLTRLKEMLQVENRVPSQWMLVQFFRISSNLFRIPDLLPKDDDDDFIITFYKFFPEFMQTPAKFGSFNGIQHHKNVVALRYKASYTYFHPLLVQGLEYITVSFVDTIKKDFYGYGIGVKTVEELLFYNYTIFKIESGVFSEYDMHKPIAVYTQTPIEQFQKQTNANLIIGYVHSIHFYDQKTTDTHEVQEFTAIIPLYKTPWFEPNSASYKCMQMIEERFTSSHCKTKLEKSYIICTCTKAGPVAYTTDVKNELSGSAKLDYDFPEEIEEGLDKVQVAIRITVIVSIGALIYCIYTKFNKKKTYKYENLERRKGSMSLPSELEMKDSTHENDEEEGEGDQSDLNIIKQ